MGIGPFVALVVLAVAWVSVLARMAFDRLGIKPLPAGRRLQGYGILLCTTGPLIDASTEVGGWSQDRYIANMVVLPLVLAGLAILVGGLVRERRERTQRRTSEL